MALHEILTRRREELGLTIDDVVAKSNVPKGTVAKIMAGITPNPQFESLKSIAYALGLSLEEIDESKKVTNNPLDILYTSYPSGNTTVDEYRRILHEYIDSLTDEEVRSMTVTFKLARPK